MLLHQECPFESRAAAAALFQDFSPGLSTLHGSAKVMLSGIALWKQPNLNHVHQGAPTDNCSVAPEDRVI